TIIRGKVSTSNRHEFFHLSVCIVLSTTRSNSGPPLRACLTTARTRSTTSRRSWPKPAARTRMRGSTDTLTRLSTTKNHDINTLLPLTSLTDRQDRVTGRLRSKPSLLVRVFEKHQPDGVGFLAPVGVSHVHVHASAILAGDNSEHALVGAHQLAGCRPAARIQDGRIEFGCQSQASGHTDVATSRNLVGVHDSTAGWHWKTRRRGC